MKKNFAKIIAVVLTLIMATSTLPMTAFAYNTGDVCPSCGSGSLSFEYFSETNHTYMCSNCHNYFMENHTFSEGVCISCGYKCPHNEYFMSCNGEKHCKTCKNCDFDFDEELHSFSYVQADNLIHNISCSVCGYFSEDEHEFENGVCTLCGATASAENTDATDYYTVTVIAGTNGKLKLDNELVMETRTYNFVKAGSEIDINDDSFFIDGEDSLYAIPDDGYVFDYWSGVPSDNTVNSDLTIVANFKSNVNYDYHYIYYNDGVWAYDDGTEITDGYVEIKPNILANNKDYYIVNNTSDSTIRIANSYSDVSLKSSTLDNHNYVTQFSNSNETTSYYLVLNGTIVTVSDIKPCTVTFVSGANGTIDRTRVVGVLKGTVVLINGNKLTVGMNNTITATPNAGCVFDSWSGISNGGAITADTTITANFKNTVDKTALESAIKLGKDYASKDYYEDLGSLNLAISDGQVVYDNANVTQKDVDEAVEIIESEINSLRLKECNVTVYKNGEKQVTSTVGYGEIYSTCSNLDYDESVIKWVKSTNGVDSIIASDSDSVEFAIYGDTDIYYYTEESQSTDSMVAMVKYVDKSERVIDIKYVNIGDAYTPDDSVAPTLAFYDFAGCDVLQGDLADVSNNGIILKAKYTVSKTEANKVTLVGLDGVTVQGKETYSAYYDEKVALAGGENFVFCDKDGNEISGINGDSIYAPHKNSTIYIKAVDTKSDNASTAITGSFTQNGYFTVNAQYYLPEDCIAVEAGIVVSKTVDDPTIGATDCVKLVSNSQGDNHEYSISISCSSTGTLNTKSYLIYKDANDTLHSVYSDANALTYGA